MDAWYGETEGTKIPPTEEGAELRASLFGTDLSRSKIRRNAASLVQAVGLIALHDFRKQRAKPLVIGTQDSQSIKRHLVDELQKTLGDALHAAVMIEMFTVKIRHGHDGRRKTQERAITFIRFRDKELSPSQPGMASQSINFSSDDHRRIQTTLSQHIGYHRCGGGLAMSSRDGHAKLEPHQLGQHFGTRNHGDLFGLGRYHFRVIRRDSRRNHND